MKSLRYILRKKQKEAWAWGALAASYQKQDPHLALKFYAKGIISAHDVTFSLKLLKGAIPLLLSNNQIIEASMCLKTATQTYFKNGWRLKPELEQLTTQPWYNSSVDENQLFGFLSSLCTDATNYLHGALEKVVGVVASIHKSGKGFEVFINRSQSLSVRMSVHKGKHLPKLGDFVELSVPVEGIEKEVVVSVLCQPRGINDVSNIDGDLKISDKGFGFVGDTFVPPFVVNHFSNGSRVSALRIMPWDKVKSRHSWKAVKLTDL